MPDVWQIRVLAEHGKSAVTQVSGPAELGRQQEGEEDLSSQSSAGAASRMIVAPPGGHARVVIAPIEDRDAISRKHLKVEPAPGNALRLTNLSKKQSVALGNGRRLEPGISCEVALPVSLTLGSRLVWLETPGPEPLQVESLAQATLPPGSEQLLSGRGTFSLATTGSIEPASLVRWLQAAMGVLQGAAGAHDFFPRAARAVVDLAGMDSGRVLLLEGGQWQVRATEGAGRHSQADWRPSDRVLECVRRDRKTFWQVPEPGQASESLLSVQAVVAAPILDRSGTVIGALYGERRQQSDFPRGRPITHLEAMLVELLASGVAAGLARVEQEQQALRARVQMEQFFTPDLAKELLARPELLQGRDREVTVMVCDIRGFSRISERLGSARTVEWVSDVMSVLSGCALNAGGVVVDYIGDEMMAMWGAPGEQPDHARRACGAALAILDQLSELDQRWRPIVGEPVQIGIGVNTGPARVGNVGSRQKFKYGPLGDTVNLASRVQGVTKYLRVPLIITESTYAQLAGAFPARRLGQVRVVNRAAAASLYQLAATETPEWVSLKQGYEKALGHFENRDFRQAARELGRLLPEHPQDGPSLVLMSRVAAYLVEEPADFSPVWELKGK